MGKKLHRYKMCYNTYSDLHDQGAVDAKNIIKKYQVLRDDGDSGLAEVEPPTANDDEILYELLGLVTLEGNATITRRNRDNARNSASTENESEENSTKDTGLRAHDKHKKKHHDKDKSKTKPKKPKTTESHTALRERDERETVKKELKATCISEIDYKVFKCIKACHKTHQDVCTRLACSDRSRRELRKECDNSCKDTFVPEAC